MQVECRYKPGTEKLAMMPRFGTELVVAPGLENIAWYGRGPKETMIDRAVRAHRRVPQHGGQGMGGLHAPAGERQQDRRALGEADQRGRARDSWPSARRPLNVTARHYTEDDMERAGYTFQMKRHPETYLNLDWRADGRGRHRQLEPERVSR